MENKENVLEFLSGQHTCVVTFTNQKHINRVKKLYEERKDEFKYFHENPDGSICAKLPLKWFKLNPGSKEKREMTEEQKEVLRQRFAVSRQNKSKK